MIIPATGAGDTQNGSSGSGGVVLFMFGLLLIVISAFAGARRRYC
jgi:hypothetical protein